MSYGCRWWRNVVRSKSVLDFLDDELDGAVGDADVDGLMLVLALLRSGIVVLREGFDEVGSVVGRGVLL